VFHRNIASTRERFAGVLVPRDLSWLAEPDGTARAWAATAGIVAAVACGSRSLRDR
jgi:hypothetical protein